MNKKIIETELRSSIYENLSVIMSAMSAPVRLRIVQILAQSPRSVEELSGEIQQSIANTSQHLQKMAAAGLVGCRKKGVSRIYSIANPQILKIWESLQVLGEELSTEVADATEELVPSELCTDLSTESVYRKVKSGRAVLVDMREEKEREASPVEWASAFTAEDLLVKASQLAVSKEYFLFCRGRYCHLANKAVVSLRKSGFKAYRLRESPFVLNTFLQDAQPSLR